MKKTLSIAVIAGLAFAQFALAATGNEGTAEGKRIFTEVCANCHGSDAGGGRAPALKPQPAEELTQKLDGFRAGTYGGARKATMEAMVKKYTPEELKDVVEYIKSL